MVLVGNLLIALSLQYSSYKNASYLLTISIFYALKSHFVKMKVSSSLALITLLSLADDVQSAITLPLKLMDKQLSPIMKHITRTTNTTITVPVRDWIEHTADLQVSHD